ncbi:MAG TPA: saccharopine dehydrogenase NADP-binding domain-containing protein [Actinomycetota bacterium]|jgi:short subunit dehydrogenase-like uncharacterized protein
MPDVLLFGATGYTGRLTAHALAKRGASFVVAGRNAAKLDALAAETGAADARVAAVGDVDTLVDALADVRVMITCVGPFLQLGDTAVEAALRARVHYVDSTGEGPFIRRLMDEHHDAAVQAGIAMAPAMGFDEVPGDVVATLAAADLDRPRVDLTYSVPSTPSGGTLRSSLDIVTSAARWTEDGMPRDVRAGRHERWAPMPPPLGPRRGASFPLAIGHIAPRHLDLEAFRTYATVGSWQRIGLKGLVPSLRAALAVPGGRALIERAIARLPEGPDDHERARKFTILGEAVAGARWRNVAITGSDVYGLTAELLAATSLRMSEDGYDVSGVVAPVQAVELELLRSELEKQGCDLTTWQSP